MSNMATRVVVAVLAIPIIVFLTYVGGFLFYIVVLVISSIALIEFYSLSERRGASPLKILGLIFGVFVVSVFSMERFLRMRFLLSRV